MHPFNIFSISGAGAGLYPRYVWQMGLGLILSMGISVIAYRREALSKSGVLGAMLTGTIIFGLGGWGLGMVLITFFVLSSLLSRYKAIAKHTLSEKFAKGSRRDLGQTLANGGAGALLSLLHAFFSRSWMLAAFVGAMATVNADTWATELGVLSPAPPRLITTGERVQPGTSGGISVLGTFATLAGAATIGLAAALFMTLEGWLVGLGVELSVHRLWLVPVAILGGGAGSLFDSLLGATVQAIYYTPSRRKETERVIDPDGTPNRHIRGWRWLTNDWVNFISSLVGAGVSAIAWGVLT
jgi:uncharacterized protein (TIGR00297 family)